MTRLIPNQSFEYWLLVRTGIDNELQLAGTQRLPTPGSDHNTTMAYFPWEDDFFKITVDDIYFKVNIKPKK